MNQEIRSILIKAIEEVREKHGLLIDTLSVEWEKLNEQAGDRVAIIFKDLRIDGYV